MLLPCIKWYFTVVLFCTALVTTSAFIGHMNFSWERLFIPLTIFFYHLKVFHIDLWKFLLWHLNILNISLFILQIFFPLYNIFHLMCLLLNNHSQLRCTQFYKSFYLWSTFFKCIFKKFFHIPQSKNTSDRFFSKTFKTLHFWHLSLYFFALLHGVKWFQFNLFSIWMAIFSPNILPFPTNLKCHLCHMSTRVEMFLSFLFRLSFSLSLRHFIV